VHATQPDITVVVGARQARGVIAACLSPVIKQLRDVNAEVIVAACPLDSTDDFVARQFPEVQLIRNGMARLVPELWGLAIPLARAPLVALTTAHCIPDHNWLASAVSVAAAHPEYAAFGGPIDAPHGGAPADWALYFARYAAFMPPVSDGPCTEIAGDNAVYRRAAIDEHWPDRSAGFWETLVHHRLRASGARLALTPELRVRSARGAAPWAFAGVRFRHGRHYGTTRPDLGRRARAGRIAAAPLLPLVLLGRIGQRIARHRPDWRAHYIRSLPWLSLFLGAWSAGEASGYLTGGRS